MQKLLKFQNKPEQSQLKMLKNQQFKAFLDQLLIGLLYGQQYLKQRNYQITRNTQYQLGELQNGKKGTLLLDLDETLMTTRIEKEKCQYEVVIDGMRVGFCIRPFARELLQILSQYYEILIFTASTLKYASKIVPYLDPTNQFISGILDRCFCYKTEENILIKDLQILSNRNLDNMLLVDNLALSYSFQPQNGIAVKSWMGEMNDKELVILTMYLKEIASQNKSLREANYERLQVGKLVEMYARVQFV